MEKRILILTVFLLCGCQNEKTIACTHYDGNDYVSLKISAVNDDIRAIEVNEVYVLPDELLAGPFYAAFEAQLDSSCRVEVNRLIRSYNLVIDDDYSLSRTIEKLQKEKYGCGS